MVVTITVSLASCLLDLPIEPKLGKMVLYGVVLKCLDPILTIVCCISYKDPFTLTANSERRTRDSAKEILAALAQGSMSDHMTLLSAFQGWQAAKQVWALTQFFCFSFKITNLHGGQ